MPVPRNSDLIAALEFVREAEAFADVESFRSGILPGLHRLIPCDVVGYNEVDVERGTVLERYHPHDALPDWLMGPLLEHAHQHPVIVRNRSGDLSPHAISDFLSERGFHALELYQDLFRQIDAEDQLSFGLPGRVTIGIAMNRPRRGFATRERSLLELLRPHLTQALEHVRERERGRTLVAGLESGLEALEGAVVVVDARERVEVASELAGELLQAYIGENRALEGTFAEWLAATDPGPATLTITGSRGRLVVRRLEREGGAPGAVLLLTEMRSSPTSVSALIDLGLTRREAEVMKLVASGVENRQIAAELGVAVKTVRKHLERIYSKLAVRSRTEAVALVLGSRRPEPATPGS